MVESVTDIKQGLGIFALRLQIVKSMKRTLSESTRFLLQVSFAISMSHFGQNELLNSLLASKFLITEITVFIRSIRSFPLGVSIRLSRHQRQNIVSVLWLPF